MKKANVQRVKLTGEAEKESTGLLIALASAPESWYEKIDENMRSVGVDPETADDDVINKHNEAANGHVATRYVMLGGFPALRRHMVECN